MSAKSDRPQIVGVITSRKGSVRIKRKAIRPLGGIPLAEWTFRAAQASCLKRVILTTDDEDLLPITAKYPKIAYIPRPPELAADVPTELVLSDLLASLEHRKEFAKIDAFCLLQPTTPLRQALEIDACVARWEELRPEVDTVFTAAPVRQRPEWMFRERPDYAQPYLGFMPEMASNISQNLEPLLYPTGGVYVISRRAVSRHQIFGNRCCAVKVPWTSAIDIEEEIDFLTAEKAMEMAKHG